MDQPTLYLLIGYPGAGKTTTAKLITEITGAAHLSSDEIRRHIFPQPTFTEHEHAQLYRHVDRELETLMKEGRDVVYDANLNRHRHREEKYELARRYNYQTKLIWIQAPRELAKSRRLEDMSNRHVVPHHESPAEMFERISHIFEPPHPDEPYQMLDGRHVSEESVRKLLE